MQIVPDIQLLQQTRNKYAPRDHPVFELVPAQFGLAATNAYIQLGQPTVSITTFWEVYISMLHELELQQDRLEVALQEENVDDDGIDFDAAEGLEEDGNEDILAASQHLNHLSDNNDESD